ncbi:hypothetical protein [Alteribacter keqinensis]|uniref:Uncharacterized protein n=1 Tax=Alteribacter keqinensis TaxID=2483800 RepID=A0A3M7TXQ1_9BACI|nr:hypothetical protein [Alteribacter keqinensis]RNA69205.1 hypothetical protein EBO34_04455 [Alteribacter keqinensis]
MTFKEKLLHQEWIQPFLPNYMKPLHEPRIEEDATSLMVHETEEFLSDLASLSELPRLNKTFKRKIKGFLLKVKIKPKKLHLEMHDTKRSQALIKKRIYITIYRKSVKAEKGLGKCIDATIYFHTDGRNIVRNVKHHPLFRPVFTHLHMLDSSLSGQNLLPQNESEETVELQRAHHNEPDEKSTLNAELKQLERRYANLNNSITSVFSNVSASLKRCLEEFNLLDVEERHQLKRMLIKEIPDLLDTYQSLTPSQKKEMEEDVIHALEKMNRFVGKIASSLDHNRMERLNHLLRVNKMRYDENK